MWRFCVPPDALLANTCEQVIFTRWWHAACQFLLGFSDNTQLQVPIVYPVLK